jgi:hypothetical protein
VGGILVRRRRVKKENKGDGIWLMDFIYLSETELNNFLLLL